MNLIDTKRFTIGIEDSNIQLFTIQNKNGLTAQITNYGGRIVSLFTPDKKGVFSDIVLGYETAKEYIEKPDHYFGAIIGRYGNRIASSKFTLDNHEYILESNEGKNQLHGGRNGFHNVIWESNQINESTIEFTHVSPDLIHGFPGNLEVKVIYSLSENNELKIDYYAITDKKTVVNLTNHSYFNLSSNFKTILDSHFFQIQASHFLPINHEMIPTGEKMNVENTPFDFRELKTINNNLSKYHKQINIGSGFDHTFVLNDTGYALCAKVSEKLSGRTLEVFTTEPGVQFYSGNHLNGIEGKEKNKYNSRTAFCLETQHFPNSPNQKEFPSTILMPKDVYNSTTIYKFDIVS